MAQVILQTCLPDYRIPLFKQLVDREQHIHVVCGRDYFTDNLTLCSIDVPWCTYVRNYFIFNRSFLWQFGVIATATKADILIAEFNPRILSTWVILIIRRLRGKPTILWGHLWGRYGPSLLPALVRRAMLRLGNGLLCYTRSQMRELAVLMPGYSAWTASNSCVSADECRASAMNGWCITYVGRLIRRKKPLLLLECFAAIVDELPRDAKLLLIGQGDQAEALRRRARELGVEERVEMFGHIGDANSLREIYDRTLITVSPGYVGLSAIQSMAHGVPMLVSKDETHSPEIEACVEGHTCVFFETDSKEDLCCKLREIYAQSTHWRARRHDISGIIRSKYTYEAMVDAFADASRVVVMRDILRAIRVAFVWAQYGPYHKARFRALKNDLGASTVVGVELASETSTYAWSKEGDMEDIITLIPNEAAEDVSAVRVYRKAREVFRMQRVSIVFVPSYWPASSLAILFAARAAGAKAIMMNDSHALTAKAKGLLAFIKKYLVSRFDAGFVAGAPQREYFSSLGMRAERIVTGCDVVDNAYFAAVAREVRREKQRYRAKHGLPSRYILNVGRMVAKKNLKVLVEAYKILRARHGQVCPKLVFVGGGPLEGSLHSLCVLNGLSVVHHTSGGASGGLADADVHFLGFRQVDELPEFYALAEVFVLPSREEEWGLVVNEAMACGLPVVVSNVAGCARDLVIHGRNGYVFDPMDVSDLVRCLENVLTEPSQAARMGTESLQIISEWGCDRFTSGAREAVAIVEKGH